MRWSVGDMIRNLLFRRIAIIFSFYWLVWFQLYHLLQRFFECRQIMSKNDTYTYKDLRCVFEGTLITCERSLIFTLIHWWYQRVLRFKNMMRNKWKNFDWSFKQLFKNCEIVPIFFSDINIYLFIIKLSRMFNWLFINLAKICKIFYTYCN